MASKRPPKPGKPLSLVQRGWQPALSIGAIILSVTSLVQADRANDIAEKQFAAEQARQRELDQKARKEARQVVLADLSDDLRTVRFSVPGEDVRLRGVVIEFPPQLKMPPVWTVDGRPQEISISEMDEGLGRLFLPAGHGPIVSHDVLAFVPVVLVANFVGRGEAFEEAYTYTIQFRSRLVNGRPRLNFESFEPDLQMSRTIKRADFGRILSECWAKYLPGVGRHDAKNSPTEGNSYCRPASGAAA